MNHIAFFFLAESNLLTWLIPVIVGILCLCAGGALGMYIHKYVRDKKIGTTKAEAQAIVDNANIEAKALKKEAILEAREEAHKLKQEHDRQVREKNQELQRQENRLNQKEEALDKKEEIVLKKIDQLDIQQKHISSQQNELNKRQQELEKSSERIEAELERVASLTKEEAKQILIESITISTC